MAKVKEPFVPDPEQMRLWPSVSGNAINGLGETERRRPSPVYWHEPHRIPHGPVQGYFYKKFLHSDDVVAERARRQRIIAERARRQRIMDPCPRLPIYAARKRPANGRA